MSSLGSYNHLQIEFATPTIGANITGIDLSQSLSAEQVTEIRRAFLDHQVLFFRNQKRIEPERLLSLGRQFGELHMHPTIPHLDGFPGVLVVHADGDSKGNYGGMWHSDVSSEPAPPLGTLLQVHTPPPYGGDTLFASMYAVYDGLSGPMKRFLEGLTALHAYLFDAPKPGQAPFPKTVHPIIRTHPETGRQALFVSRLFASRVVELNPSESSMLLNYLFTQIENPYYHVRLKWQENDVAFWDNRCTQHLAVWDYKPHTRTGYRVTIQGDRPYFRAEVD